MANEAERRHVNIRLSDEALEWIVRLNSGRADEGDRQDFAAWRSRDVEHELAAQEAETLWHNLGAAGTKVRKGVSRRAVLGAGIAAMSGAALYGSGILGPRLFAEHVTGVAERRSIDLPDGSTAFLNVGSALSVDFSDASRALRLHQGQATFTVAHDVVRPFVVEAEGGRTRAIGTVFDVDIRPREVAVTVLEGTVGVTNGKAADAVVAKLNHRVTYSAGMPPSDAEPVDAASETAWRRGKLIFNGRQLGDVVAEIERYRRGSIVIVGNGLRALPVTGVFDLAEPDTVLDVVAETLPVQVTHLPFVTIIR